MPRPRGSHTPWLSVLAGGDRWARCFSAGQGWCWRTWAGVGSFLRAAPRGWRWCLLKGCPCGPGIRGVPTAWREVTQVSTLLGDPGAGRAAARCPLGLGCRLKASLGGAVSGVRAVVWDALGEAWGRFGMFRTGSVSSVPAEPGEPVLPRGPLQRGTGEKGLPAAVLAPL